MKLKSIFAIIVITIIIGVRFFCGVYVHDEFAEHHFFIKHRPVWKWKFTSPIGLSDAKFEDLSKEQKIEQKYYEEVVRDKIH